MQSFVAVTGPKVNLWLVQAFGMIVLAHGVVMILLPLLGVIEVSLIVFGLASASMLAFIDAYFAFGNVISKVYLLDGAFELGVVICWVLTLKSFLGGER
ncbi:MAG: hypothetical protein QM784_32295 [Polyangiaceae bacterium]